MDTGVVGGEIWGGGTILVQPCTHWDTTAYDRGCQGQIGVLEEDQRPSWSREKIN